MFLATNIKHNQNVLVSFHFLQKTTDDSVVFCVTMKLRILSSFNSKIIHILLYSYIHKFPPDADEYFLTNIPFYPATGGFLL